MVWIGFIAVDQADKRTGEGLHVARQFCDFVFREFQVFAFVHRDTQLAKAQTQAVDVIARQGTEGDDEVAVLSSLAGQVEKLAEPGWGDLTAAGLFVGKELHHAFQMRVFHQARIPQAFCLQRNDL